MQHRQVWPTQIGGFLVSVGFLTGIANMALFPSAICERGQAGAFILAYVICVFLVGFPLTYLHLCLGQYSGCNPTKVFGKLCPAFKGIGWCWLILTIPMMIITNMNTAWSLYYMYIAGKSLVTSTYLPWRYHEMAPKPSLIVNFNSTDSIVADEPSDYFHHIYHTAAPKIVMSLGGDLVLRVVNKVIVLGNIEWRLVVVLALAWLLVTLCTLNNSVHTMNRVVYVTATLPMVILLLLLIRVIDLPNALEGISLLYPDTNKIFEFGVWQNAIKLVFFDMQIGVGVLIAISKHNRFHTNVFRDALLLVVIDLTVSLCASCVAFGFLGFMAYQLNTDDIRSMCRGQTAPHLIWDQILRAISYLPKHEANLYCFFYQLMLGVGALECSFTLCEVFSSALDRKIKLFRKRKALLRIIVAIVMFGLTLPCCFQGGVYIYNLLVFYSMHWNVKVVALCQFLVIGYFYGVKHLCKDITNMLRISKEEEKRIFMTIFGPTGYYVRYSWTYLCPFVVTIALVMDLMETPEHRSVMAGDSQLWHILSIVTIIPLPVMVLFKMVRRDKKAFKPSAWIEIKTPFDDSTITSGFFTETDDWFEAYRNNGKKKDCTINPAIIGVIDNKAATFVEFSSSSAPYWTPLRPMKTSIDIPAPVYNEITSTSEDVKLPLIRKDDGDDDSCESDVNEETHSLSSSSSKSNSLRDLTAFSTALLTPYRISIIP
ncbi:unnamed protein product [Bursaphelenchus xylophilus]|uniref:(pine wood nematode) hypothetical protein n=1 Tax=Bursaphelenchus xylophilus TaxID=6326 RepID=A0A7I8WHV5_BURXY|nr:unnamed protein product [Bursaphelenchus xylophilus]CAG9109300.1 unnamed protein product [Bursaphelenchus xylophilus]